MMTENGKNENFYIISISNQFSFIFQAKVNKIANFEVVVDFDNFTH